MSGSVIRLSFFTEYIGLYVALTLQTLTLPGGYELLGILFFFKICSDVNIKDVQNSSSLPLKSYFRQCRRNNPRGRHVEKLSLQILIPQKVTENLP